MVDYNKVLDEKFVELSELFTKLKDFDDVEPEQKCAVITSMLQIYEIRVGS